MYKNILVPVAADHGPNSGKAMEAARLLLSEGGKITALTVVEAIPGYVAQYLPEGQMERTAVEVATSLKAEVGGAKDVQTAVVSGHAGPTILDFAARNGADCIVIASHRPGLQDYFLGSTAARVVRHAQCAVHVVR